MDFVSSLDAVQEAILMAKPRDIFGFVIRYYQDEKDNNQIMHYGCSNINYNTEDLHAIHMLPFLIQNHIEFQNKASIIFCNQINNNEIYSKDYVDHTIVLDILKKINLEAFKLKIKAIDEFVYQRIIGLKKVYFDVFVSCLRLPLACYQIVIWLKDELYSSHMNSDQVHNNKKESSPSKPTIINNNNNNDSSNNNNNNINENNNNDVDNITKYIGFLQSEPTETVDLERLKLYLQRHPLIQVIPLKVANNNSHYSHFSGGDRNRKVSVSCSYHMNNNYSNTILLEEMHHPATATATSSIVVVWLQLLRSIVTRLLEPSVTSLQSDHKYIKTKDLIEEFMSQYLQQRNI